MSIKPLLNEINNLDDWNTKREAIKENFFSMIGMPPYKRNTRDIKILQVENLEVYDRLKIQYSVGYSDLVFAYLLVPKNIIKSPAVLVMHQFQNSDYGKKEPAGIAGNKDLFLGHELAVNGYVVLIPDYLTAGERIQDNQIFNTKSFYRENPQWSIIGKNLEDSFSAVDVMLTFDFVDKTKIGVIGHSFGGHNSILSLAFDERVRVGVSNCGFSVLSEEETVMEWVDENYNFMPAMKQFFITKKELPFDFHEIASLICPRPWLNISSYYDRAYGNQEFLAETGRMLYEVYKFQGKESNFAYFMHGGNHSYPKYARELSYAWLDRHLKG